VAGQSLLQRLGDDLLRVVLVQLEDVDELACGLRPRQPLAQGV
jgi:hypothetical protein